MMGVQSAMGKEENKSQNSLEEVKREKDIRNNLKTIESGEHDMVKRRKVRKIKPRFPKRRKKKRR